ncbi:MAG: DNA-binding protein WhiA [Agathobaculum sp.]|jgi:DNA-binding protein WhiA|uniref:DNA-binding protein WhiA n=1 Tax=Agathobaculum sp. TaxID=2048138 RepID=UPI003D90B693
MSFSTQVKNELCRAAMHRPCCIRAEAYGALLHATIFSHREIRLNTENAEIARRLQLLLRRAFSVDCAPRQAGSKIQLVLEHAEQLGHIFDALGYDLKNHVTYHINRNVLEEDCCIAAFLRGVFLMAGTVAGPDKKSHLELKTARHSLAGEETSLLLDLHLSPKMTRRGSTYVLYFKDGASIEDFLTSIGAPRAAMELMEAKVEKTLRNTINRQVNCETANMVKAADASARQVAAIQRVLRTHGEAFFPERLRETVRLRLAYPTDSLAELAARFDPPISKPGLSHRLKKITELSAAEEE